MKKNNKEFIVVILVESFEKNSKLTEYLIKKLKNSGVEYKVLTENEHLNTHKNDFEEVIQDIIEFKSYIIVSVMYQIMSRTLYVSGESGEHKATVLKKHGLDFTVQIKNPYFPHEKIIFVENWKKLSLGIFNEHSEYTVFSQDTVDDFMKVIK